MNSGFTKALHTAQVEAFSFLEMRIERVLCNKKRATDIAFELFFRTESPKFSGTSVDSKIFGVDIEWNQGNF
jgi:hypothetical protein